MTDKEKTIKELKEALDSLDITNKYRLNLIRAIEYLQEEPVSNPIDFEKELYKAFGQVKDFTLGMRIAKWFYDMGKNSQEPVSEDLEEAVNTYIGYPPEVDECSSVYGKRQAFKAGARWKEQQMINGAVETIIHSKPNDYGEFMPIIHVKVGSSYKDGEKVRIIIIKDE